eukprot:864971-Pyramimonas_sp.AAC.1
MGLPVQDVVIVATLITTTQPAETRERTQEASGFPIVSTELARIEINKDRLRQLEERTDERVIPQGCAQRVLDRPIDAKPLAHIDQPSGDADVPRGTKSIGWSEGFVTRCASGRTARPKIPIA